MPQAMLAAPLVLALVLAGGGVLKLRDDDAATALEWDALGLPDRLNRRWARRAHPWGEIVLAAALLCLPGVLGVLAAVAALLLTLAYLVLVTAAVTGRTEARSCACFGGGRQSALTGWTVLRNAVLLLLAALAILRSLDGGAVLGELAGSGEAAAWALALVLAMVTTVLVSAPLGAQSEPAPATGTTGAARPEPAAAAGGSPAGEAAPSAQEGEEDEEVGEYLRTLTPRAVLTQANGAPVDLLMATRAQAHLLLYLSPGCGHCETIAERVPEWVEQMPQLAVKVVVTGTPAQLADRRPEWAAHALYDGDALAVRMLQLHATPSAVLLGTDGMLAGGPVSGASEVIDLVEDIKVQLGIV